MKNRFNKHVLRQGTICVFAHLLLALLVTDAANGQSYSEMVRSLDPVALWRLGEFQGKAAKEEIGSRFGWYRGGVRFGAAGPVQYETNAAARFDGQSGCVRISHNDAFRLDRGAVVFWFNADDVKATQGLLSKDAAGFGDGGHLTLTLQGGEVHARLQSNVESYEVQSARVQQHRWHHIAFTFGSAGMRLYLDGRLVDSKSYQGGLGQSSGSTGNREPLVLGAGAMNSQSASAVPLQHFFHGRLDEVAIFRAQISAEQIEALFAAAHPTYRSLAEGYALNGPLAWWRLDEEPGELTARDQVDALHGHYHVHGPYFDGDDYVDAGVLDVEGESMTILACIRAKSFSAPNARIVAKATALKLEDHYWMLSTASVDDNPRLRFRLHTSKGVREIVSSHELGTGKWIFVAGVYNGKRIHLYQDGELVGSFPHGGRIKTNSHTHVWFGDSPSGAGSRPFDGDIRDVAVFDRSLSTNQIRAIFRAKTVPPPDVPPSDGLPPDVPPSDGLPPAPQPWEVIPVKPLVVVVEPPPVTIRPAPVRTTIPTPRYRVYHCPICGELIYEPIYQLPIMLDGHAPHGGY